MKKTVLLSLIAGVLCFGIGFGAVALTGALKTPPEPAAVTPEVKNLAGGITVTAVSFYPESGPLMLRLQQMGISLEKGQLTEALLTTELEAVIRELEQLGFYYDYIGKTSTATEDGTVFGASPDADDPIFGASPDAGGPIGGGAGYGGIYTTGDYIVTDDNTFYAAALEARAGEVIFIPGGTVIDLGDMKYTEYNDLVLNPGVILASDRGHNGSTGGILKIGTVQPILFTLSDDVRMTGLVIQGADPYVHTLPEEYDPVDGIRVMGENVRIDNCEISAFGSSGILLEEGTLQVDHCYIHHIRGIGAGSGILARGGHLAVFRNLFSNCRDGITVTDGAEFLIAEDNVEVGNSLGALVRMAAGETESTAVPGMMASAAHVEVRNNTVLGRTPLIALEGMPGALTVENNLLMLTEAQYDPALHYGPEEFRQTIRTRILFRNNAFDPTAPQVVSWNENLGES